jgi:hypothetical protein
MKYQAVMVVDDAESGREEKRGDHWIFDTREAANAAIKTFEFFNEGFIESYRKAGGSVTFNIEEVEEGGEPDE